MSEEELSFQGDGEYHEKKRRSGDVDYTESQDRLCEYCRMPFGTYGV